PPPRAVATNDGDERILAPERLHARQHLGERRAGIALPPGHAHDAVADVDRGDDALRAEALDDRAQQLASVSGNGADDDLLRAGVDPRPCVGDAANTAADLHAQVAPRQS